MSPSVASRIVCPSATVVTPRSAARSSRGSDDDFRPDEIALNAWCAKFRYRAHLFGDLVRDLDQLHGIVAAELKRHVAPAAAAAFGAAAGLRLEVDARVRDRRQLGRERALDLDAGALAVVAERQVEIGAAHVDPLDNLNHFRRGLDDAARLRGNGLRLGARGARRRPIRTVLKSRSSGGMKVKEKVEKSRPVTTSDNTPPRIGTHRCRSVKRSAAM
jgi:hypothetical protein